MKAIIQPSKLSGEIIAPPSKSYTHRAIILASLAAGKSHIANALISDDTKATINACKLLGAKIKLNGTNLEIVGTNGLLPRKNSTVEINCRQSGTTMRLMTAAAVLSPGEIILTGEQRLLERPIGELVRTFKSLGVDIIASENNQFPPIMIKGGNFPGGKIKISGKISSQFISALLIIAPYAKKDTEITVSYLKSAPYIDITVDLMKTFGVNVQKSGNIYKVKAGQKYKARKYTVEGDYSSASYFFAAAAITNSKIAIHNLNPDSAQGDKYFLEIIRQMKNAKSNGIFNMGNYPDIVPTAAVCAAGLKAETKIINIGHLRAKESDRIKSVENGLRRMQIKVVSNKDSLTIRGGDLIGSEIDTYNDHRIAMSFAVAGLVAGGETIINNAEVVNKSYPDFWRDLQKIGAKIKIIN